MGINATNTQSYYLEALKNQQPQNNFRLANSYVNTPMFNNNVQQPAVDSFNNKTVTPADGKDDGSIGFFGALKNMVKGVGNFFKGMVCDENGKFSITRALTTIGIGAAIGVACAFLPTIAVAGMTFSTLGLISAGFGAIAAYHVGDAAIDIMSAKTDAEAEQGWQNLGSGLTEGGLAYLGYRASGGIMAKDTVAPTPSGSTPKTPKATTEEAPVEPTRTSAPKAEAEAKAKAEAEAKAKAEAEAKAKAEAEAKAKAEAEAEAEAQAIAEVDSKMPYNNIQHLSRDERLAYYDEQYSIHKYDPNFKNSVPMHGQIFSMNAQVRMALKNKENNSVMQYNDVLENIDVFDSFFGELSPTTHDVIGFRGRAYQGRKSADVDFEIIENAKVGDIITPDTGYSYFAFENSVGEFTGGDKSLVYIARFPQGAKVSRCTAHFDDGMGGEIVTPRGARYKLLAKTVDSEGNIKVYIEYIVEEPPKPAKVNETLKQAWLEE